MAHGTSIFAAYSRQHSTRPWHLSFLHFYDWWASLVGLAWQPRCVVVHHRADRNPQRCCVVCIADDCGQWHSGRAFHVVATRTQRKTSQDTSATHETTYLHSVIMCFCSSVQSSQYTVSLKLHKVLKQDMLMQAGVGRREWPRGTWHTRRRFHRTRRRRDVARRTSNESRKKLTTTNTTIAYGDGDGEAEQSAAAPPCWFVNVTPLSLSPNPHH